MEKIIEQNDKPRAEIVVDVEILEVDRSADEESINLSDTRSAPSLARDVAERARRRRQWPPERRLPPPRPPRWTSTAPSV